MQDRSSWPPAVQSIVAAAEAAAAEAAAADMQQQAEAAEAALESELETLRTEQAAAMCEASAAMKARYFRHRCHVPINGNTIGECGLDSFDATSMAFCVSGCTLCTQCRQAADAEADRLAAELRDREAASERLAAAHAEAAQATAAAAAEAADAEQRAAAAQDDVREWQVRCRRACLSAA